MLSEQLVELVEQIQKKQCEMQNIELKKAEKGTPERLYDSLSSFANQPGGFRRNSWAISVPSMISFRPEELM